MRLVVVDRALVVSLTNLANQFSDLKSYEDPMILTRDNQADVDQMR